jgi:hypothetical protein
VGGGGEDLPTTPHSLNTLPNNTVSRRPPHPSYTQQHTTTLHSSTRVQKTTNVPVVFMARYVMLLRGATSSLGAFEGVGPENQDLTQLALSSLVPSQGPKKSQFSGYPLFNAPHDDVAPLKIITYRAIKNNRYINSYYAPKTHIMYFIRCC